MPATQKSAISFGLVHIPVSLYAAARDSDVRFNLLTRDSLGRVQYKKTEAGTEKELDSEDIVRGYEYEKDKYVVVTDEDFEKIKTEQDRRIQILLFTEPGEIPPAYLDRSFLVASPPEGATALELLRRAMLEENKVAVGKTNIRNKETMLVLRPGEEGIIMQTLYFHDEVQQLPAETPRPAVRQNELELAKMLVGAMTGPFEPQKYEDEYQKRLKELIQKKIEGVEIPPQPSEPTPDNLISLVDALRESLQKLSG